MTPPERLQDVTLAERLRGVTVAWLVADLRHEGMEAEANLIEGLCAECVSEPHEKSEAAAALSVRGDLLIAAYDAGFDASGEGWNGEYGANTDGRHYIEKRTQALAELSATPPSEG